MSAVRYRDSTVVDFVVVGSGAAGGVLARELSTSGFSTVVLEQGARLTPADFEHDELKYWFLGGITNNDGRSPQTFRSDPQRSQDSERPGEPASLYSSPHFQQCRVSAMAVS